MFGYPILVDYCRIRGL
uniref:Uncharacterized protein n=1 Tax=Rhizophora mucronata TaxID=61149 RepID=A0A2P2IVJ9_RHIMU